MFIDQEHTLLLPSIQHLWRTVFRAAGASVNAAEARPGSKPPCLSTFKNVRGWPLSVPFCAVSREPLGMRLPMSLASKDYGGNGDWASAGS